MIIKNGELQECSICMNSAHTVVDDEIIKPIVIMKSGVFNDYLKTPADLELSTKWWEGIPIVIKNEFSTKGHPDTVIVTNKTFRVGQVRNIRWDLEAEKLVADAHIDTKLCPKWLLDDIGYGKVKGVSGTYFVDLLPNDGEKEGKKYTHIEKNYVPNNIAIVDNPACTPKDGCGLNMNEKIETDCAREDSEYELDDECNPKLDEKGNKILKIKVEENSEGDKMTEEMIKQLETRLADMEVQMNSMKDELKVKTDELAKYETAKKEMEFLSQFPEVNREAAKTELLPIFMEDPARLVTMNSKRLGELLVPPGVIVDESKGAEHVELDLGDVETNEDKEIEAVLPDREAIKKMISGRV